MNVVQKAFVELMLGTRVSDAKAFMVSFSSSEVSSNESILLLLYNLLNNGVRGDAVNL